MINRACAPPELPAMTRFYFDIRANGKMDASVLILKSGSFYAFASRVRRQKRWMLARMSSAVLVQRKGFGSALVASM